MHIAGHGILPYGDAGAGSVMPAKQVQSFLGLDEDAFDELRRYYPGLRATEEVTVLHPEFSNDEEE